MNKILTAIILILSFGTSGCFFSVPKKSSFVSSATVNVNGKVIREDQFKDGGTLAILPFKAGENAVASTQLDRVALMIVKGMTDYLTEEGTPFIVLTTQDQGKPDIIIDGYIDNFTQPGTMKRWVMGNKKTGLAVRGYMEMFDSKERIFIFEQKKSMADPKKDGLDLAYAMGRDIGRFIVDSLE